MFENDTVFFVTNRTIQGRFLLTPTTEINNAIGAVLANAVCRYQVQLFAFAFLSNHYHLIVKTPKGNLSQFMQFLNANIAKRVAKIVDWPDKVWARRFSAEPILDNAALEERLQYVVSHGVKEGLVERVREWPGLHCVQFILEDKQEDFVWKAGSSQNAEHETEGDTSDSCPLKTTRFPVWNDLSQSELRSKIENMIAVIENEAHEQRKGRVLGVKSILECNPHHRPSAKKSLIRPMCHASKPDLITDYKSKYKKFVESYRSSLDDLVAAASKLVLPTAAYWPPPIALGLSP